VWRNAISEAISLIVRAARSVTAIVFAMGFDVGRDSA
jgi:hypothetical protein